MTYVHLKSAFYTIELTDRNNRGIDIISSSYSARSKVCFISHAIRNYDSLIRFYLHHYHTTF